MADKDITFINKWLDESVAIAYEVKKRAAVTNVQSIFTIGTTVKLTKSKRPYLTPIRELSHGIIGGSVVFTQLQAILLCVKIDGIVDRIMVDSEKKIDVNLDVHNDIYKLYKIKRPKKDIKTITEFELGNISNACFSYVKQSKFNEYKPNDLTVEAVWHNLSRHFKILSGKKISIVGCGNIGFKIGLKLVESGCNVNLMRRDIYKGMLMANLINMVKPSSTIATAYYSVDKFRNSLFADAIIGCTNGTEVISWKMIQCMNNNGIIIDVGKGTIISDAISRISKLNIKLIRCDIYSALDGHITTMKKFDEFELNMIGRKEIEKGIYTVSGGFMGSLDDIVVDNYNEPKQIIGIANGKGDFKSKLSKNNENNIISIKKRYKIG